MARLCCCVPYHSCVPHRALFAWRRCSTGAGGGGRRYTVVCVCAARIGFKASEFFASEGKKETMQASTSTPATPTIATPAVAPTVVGAVFAATPTAMSMATPTAVLAATPTAVFAATPTAVLAATPTAVLAATPTAVLAATPTAVLAATPTAMYMATPTTVLAATPTATPLVVHTSTGVVVPVITAAVAPAGGGAGAILLEKAVAELHAVLRREIGAGGGLTTSFGFPDSGGVWMRADSVADVVTLGIVHDASIGGPQPIDVEDGSVLVAVKFEEQEPYSWQLLLHANGAIDVQPLMGGAAPGVELRVRCVVFRRGLPAFAGDCFIEVCAVNVRGRARAAVVTDIVAQGALAKRPQRSHFASFQSRVFRLHESTLEYEHKFLSLFRRKTTSFDLRSGVLEDAEQLCFSVRVTSGGATMTRMFRAPSMASKQAWMYLLRRTISRAGSGPGVAACGEGCAAFMVVGDTSVAVGGLVADAFSRVPLGLLAEVVLQAAEVVPVVGLVSKALLGIVRGVKGMRDCGTLGAEIELECRDIESSVNDLRRLGSRRDADFSDLAHHLANLCEIVERYCALPAWKRTVKQAWFREQMRAIFRIRVEHVALLGKLTGDAVADLESRVAAVEAKLAARWSADPGWCEAAFKAFKSAIDRQIARTADMWIDGTRDWVLTDICSWIGSVGSKNAKHLFWLHGDGGIGKSGVMARVAADPEYHVHAVHFCKYTDPDSRDPVRVIGSLVHQLRLARPSLDCSDEFARSRVDKQETPAAQFHRVVIEHCIREQMADMPVVVLIVDALDESTVGDGSTAVADMLHGAVQGTGLPKNVRLLVTSRSTEGMRRRFERWAHCVDAAEERNVKDVELAIEFVLDASIFNHVTLGVARPTTEKRREWVSSLTRKAGGLFLYVNNLRESFSRDTLVLSDDSVDELPDCVAEQMSENLKRIEHEFRGTCAVHDVVCVLIAVMDVEVAEWFSYSDTANAAGLEGAMKSNVVSALTRQGMALFQVASCVVPAHKLVREFLTSEDRTFAYPVADGHSLLVRWAFLYDGDGLAEARRRLWFAAVDTGRDVMVMDMIATVVVNSGVSCACYGWFEGCLADPFVRQKLVAARAPRTGDVEGEFRRACEIIQVRCRSLRLLNIVCVSARDRDLPRAAWDDPELLDNA